MAEKIVFKKKQLPTMKLLKPMFRLIFLLLPCIALAQYPKAMDFSKLYQGKLDSVAVVHRTGWTKETSWPEAPEEEHITERRKRLPLSEGNHLLRILRNKRGYKEEYPLLNDVVSSFLVLCKRKRSAYYTFFNGDQATNNI